MTKKNMLVNTIVTGALALLSTPNFSQPMMTAEADPSNAVVPFHISIPQAALTDLRQRILATRWPNMETV